MSPGADLVAEALALRLAGRFADSLEATKRIEGRATHPDDRVRLLALQSDLLIALGRWTEAESATRELLRYRVDGGEAPWGTEIATLNHAWILENQGRLSEALLTYDESARRFDRLPYHETDRASRALIAAFLRYGDFARLERFEQERQTGFTFDPLEPSPYRRDEPMTESLYRMARAAELNHDRAKASRGYGMFLEQAGMDHERAFHAVDYLLGNGAASSARGHLMRYPEAVRQTPGSLLHLETWADLVMKANIADEGIDSARALEQDTQVLLAAPVSLARAYAKLGAEEDAMRTYRAAVPRLESWEIDTEGFFEHPGDTERYCADMVEAYLATGQGEKALAFLERRYGRLGNPDPGLPGPVKSAIRHAVLASGDAGLQRDVLRDAMREHRARAERIITRYPEDDRVQAIRRLAPFDLPFSSGDPRLAADAALMFKGLVLESLIRERRMVASSISDPSVHDRWKELQSLRRIYLREELRETPHHLLDPLDRRITALEDEIFGRSLARERLVDLENFTADRVSASLGPDAALVEFVFHRRLAGGDGPSERLAAVILCREKPPRLHDLGAAADARTDVAALRDWVGQARRGAISPVNLNMGMMTACQRLYERIWAPLEADLRGVSTIYVSPDGFLHQAPLAALLDPDRIYAAEKWSIRHVGSGRDLLAAGSKVPTPSRRAVLLGDPEFTGDLSHDFAPAAESDISVAALLRRSGRPTRFNVTTPLPPLPGTRAEAENLGRLFRDAGFEVASLVGADARESALFAEASPEFLHLATHGVFRRDEGSSANPMTASFLALAGADATLDSWSRDRVPEPDGDGILLAAEASSLNLAGTRLVALSACDSGLGEDVAGEGVLGLKRALLQAGARGVLSTLWEIADEETVQYMANFYGRVLSGDSVGRAHAATQAEMLRRHTDDHGIALGVFLAAPFVVEATGT